MSPLLSHGEDKPPLNLSTGCNHGSERRDSTPLTSNGSAIERGSGKARPPSERSPNRDSAPTLGVTPCRKGDPRDELCLGNDSSEAIAEKSSTSEGQFSEEVRDNPTTSSSAVIKDGNTYPEGGLAAWLVVLGSFSGMVASFGILNSVGTFQAYISSHQLANSSPGSIGWVFSIFAFLTFFCGVQIGPVFDAKGPRWIVAAGSIFLFAGMMGVAESTSMFKTFWIWLAFLVYYANG